jgi:hypothetical protein
MVRNRRNRRHVRAGRRHSGVVVGMALLVEQVAFATAMAAFAGWAIIETVAWVAAL